MNSLLPSSYVFTKTKVITPDRVNYPRLFGQPAGKVFITLILSVVIALVLIYLCTKIAHKTKNLIINLFLGLVIVLGLTSLICNITLVFIGFADSAQNIQLTAHQGIIDLNFNKPLVYPYSLDCDFKFKPHSNLVIRQVVDDPLLTHNDHKKRDYALYYKLNDQDASLMGQMENKHFKFDNSGNRDNLFLQTYFAYIKDKHLENKFKNTMYLEPYLDITANDAGQEYQLRGDHITLRLTPNRTVHVYQTKS